MSVIYVYLLDNDVEKNDEWYRYMQTLLWENIRKDSHWASMRG